MENCILYERQPDGTYKRSGELPAGTRFATVTSSAGAGLAVIKRVKEWEEILARGPLNKEWYRVIPAAAPRGMSDEAKAKLRELSKRKKEERETVEEKGN
jgi:hypothetical protein